MKKVSKIKIKPKFSMFLKIFCFFICISLGFFLFYCKQIHDLTSLEYSKEASKNILFSFKKDYILSVGKNETLNAAFESKYYDENYLDNYRKIHYVSHKRLILHINRLLKKGYSNSDINIILSHGNDEAVERFTERDKVKYLEEFFSVPYAKLDNYDRYVAYSDETGEDEEDTVLFVNLDLDKEDYNDSTLVEKFSLDMLVNKHHHLSSDFEPNDLVAIDKKYASDDGFLCNSKALDAYIKMSQKALEEGYQIVINSAYRSYQDQEAVVNDYLKAYGQSYVDKYVAKPGYSEHQTGLAFDIGSKNVSVFLNSKEYKWMLEHAYEYGFIHRFSKSGENITGFRNEPWHYRYVGEKAAKYIYDNKLTLEAYWAIFLDK